jgi:hypothetical protein
MRTLVMCGFCHSMAPAGSLCPNCGHEAGVPRMECCCQQCVGLEQEAEAAAVAATDRHRRRFFCTACHVNEVDALGGWDTCDDCLARQ